MRLGKYTMLPRSKIYALNLACSLQYMTASVHTKGQKPKKSVQVKLWLVVKILVTKAYVYEWQSRPRWLETHGKHPCEHSESEMPGNRQLTCRKACKRHIWLGVTAISLCCPEFQPYFYMIWSCLQNTAKPFYFDTVYPSIYNILGAISQS